MLDADRRACSISSSARSRRRGAASLEMAAEARRRPIDRPGGRPYPRAMTDQRPYDDRDGWIWFDGKLVPWREANVHVLTHALHYASSVFEGQRAYGGEIFKLTEHSTRLRKSARAARLRNPVERRGDRRRLPRGARRQRPQPTPICARSPGAARSRWASRRSAAKIHLAIACWDWGNYFSEEAVRAGLRLDISPWRRPAPYTAPTESKAAGLYMICTLARHAAQAKGYDDALMLDWRGQVAEATGANAFFVRDGALHTPIPDCFLNGITRQTVIDLARRRGIEVHRAGDLARGAGELRAILPHRQRRRGLAGRLRRAVEFRGRRSHAADAQRLSRPGQPPAFEHLSAFDPGAARLYSRLARSAGASPSGKAPVFGTGIRRFESCRPSHLCLRAWLQLG